MIPSKQKVGVQLFKTLTQKGRSFHSESFSLRVFFDDKAERPHFSVVVTKKLEKSAVKRNAMKRKVFVLLRPFLSLARKEAVCAIFLKKKTDSKTLPALKVEIEVALKKAGVVG